MTLSSVLHWPKRAIPVLLAALLAGAAAPPPEQNPLLERVEAYFNGIDTLKADFLQIAPDGAISEGEFYLRRPGRMRFEYEPPAELLVIADGTWVVVHEKDMRSFDRYPIKATPLAVLLEDHIDLTKAALVTDVAEEGGVLRVSLRNPEEPTQGELTLFFTEEPFELRQWVVVDAQGLVTRVNFSDIETNARLDPGLFVFRDPNAPDRLRRHR